MKAFDWDRTAGGNLAQKDAFHRTARSRLKLLANELGLAAGSYEIRSNKGGPAVSGEVTLHHDHVYVQASQPLGSRNGLLIRTCEGRKDYTGGRNHLVGLRELDDPSSLAGRVRAIQPLLDEEPDADLEPPRAPGM